MRVLAATMATFAFAVAEACPTCRPKVEATVYDGTFWPNLGLLAIPFALILAIATVVHRSDGRRA